MMRLGHLLDLSTREPYGPGWHGLYHAIAGGTIVGLVERDHRFDGSRIDPEPFYVPACRLDRAAGEPACWNSGDVTYPSLTEAKRSLAGHLEEAHPERAAEWGGQ